MLELLQTFMLDIEATANDPALNDALPLAEPGVEEMGTLSSTLVKAFTRINIWQRELHAESERLSLLPPEEQEKQAAKFMQLKEKLQAHWQLFWFAVKTHLAGTTRPKIWSEVILLGIRKDWLIVGVTPQSMFERTTPMVFVAIGNPEDAGQQSDDVDDCPENLEPVPLTDRKKMN